MNLVTKFDRGWTLIGLMERQTFNWGIYQFSSHLDILPSPPPLRETMPHQTFGKEME